MSTFSAELRAGAAEIWEAQHRHPFVRGIGDGTLDLERFRFWVRQDYLFLIEYSRLLALAIARAPDVHTMGRFAELVHETLHDEMDLHRSYSAELGIPAAHLEREVMAPTTRGYTDFLLRTATVGDFAELVAALLPCMWGFNEIGRRLAENGPPDDQRYARWIEMYASDEFTALADWLRELTDRIGADLAGAPRERCGKPSSPAAGTNSPSGRWRGRWRPGRRATDDEASADLRPGDPRPHLWHRPIFELHVVLPDNIAGRHRVKAARCARVSFRAAERSPA